MHMYFYVEMATLIVWITGLVIELLNIYVLLSLFAN
jgi:hypothetical protein